MRRRKRYLPRSWPPKIPRKEKKLQRQMLLERLQRTLPKGTQVRLWYSKEAGWTLEPKRPRYNRHKRPLRPLLTQRESERLRGWLAEDDEQRRLQALSADSVYPGGTVATVTNESNLSLEILQESLCSVDQWVADQEDVPLRPPVFPAHSLGRAIHALQEAERQSAELPRNWPTVRGPAPSSQWVVRVDTSAEQKPPPTEEEVLASMLQRRIETEFTETEDPDVLRIGSWKFRKSLLGLRKIPSAGRLRSVGVRPVAGYKVQGSSSGRSGKDVEAWHADSWKDEQAWYDAHEKDLDFYYFMRTYRHRSAEAPWMSWPGKSNVAETLRVIEEEPETFAEPLEAYRQYRKAYG